MKPPDPKVIAMAIDEEALWAIYEVPRRWWHREQRYSVRRYPGQEITEDAA